MGGHFGVARSGFPGPHPAMATHGHHIYIFLNMAATDYWWRQLKRGHRLPLLFKKKIIFFKFSNQCTLNNLKFPLFW